MSKHHYVPQFYLRRFGTEKYVSAVLMDYDFRFVERASIRDQSCRPDYYEIPDVEKINGLIEWGASHLMKNVAERVPLTTDQATFFKRYIVFQAMRTPTWVQKYADAQGAMVSSAYTMLNRFEEPPRSDLESPIKFTGAEMWAWALIGDMCDRVLDLELRYLVSKCGNFLTSDQPVAAYNPWAVKGDFSGQGFGCRGLMLFLPVNSQMTAMLYDGDVYTVRSKDRKSKYIVVESEDEKKLNKLQIVGYRNTLYLPRPERHPEIQALARELRSAYPPEPPVTGIARSEDGLSQIATCEDRVIDFGDWSFLYQSKDWRQVARKFRSFGVYGSRDSTPNDGSDILQSTRSWNSVKYRDDEGNTSFLRRPTRYGSLTGMG